MLIPTSIAALPPVPIIPAWPSRPTMDHPEGPIWPQSMSVAQAPLSGGTAALIGLAAAAEGARLLIMRT